MRTPDHPWYRDADGTFRIDHYRREAQAMRRSAIHDSYKLRSAFKLVVVVVLLLGMVAIAPPRQSDSVEFTAMKRGTSQTASHGAPVQRPLF